MRETEIVDLWAYEYAAFSDGYKLVCGIDEAGRGIYRIRIRQLLQNA